MKYNEFEKALSRLEEIVSLLEGGDLNLETSLQLFEEGMKISEFCGEKLNEAERKVEMLVRSGGKLQEKPLDSSSYGDEEMPEELP